MSDRLKRILKRIGIFLIIIAVIYTVLSWALGIYALYLLVDMCTNWVG